MLVEGDANRPPRYRDITSHDWNVNYRGYVELFHTLAAEKFVMTCHSGTAFIPPMYSS
jgi:hypothetical protein